MVNRQEILKKVEAERQRQIFEKKHTPKDDDGHAQNDWVAFIASCAGRGADNAFNARHGLDFRAQMVKVAALAVAAIEWHDRQQDRQQEATGVEAGRQREYHYALENRSDIVFYVHRFDELDTYGAFVDNPHARTHGTYRTPMHPYVPEHEFEADDGAWERVAPGHDRARVMVRRW